MQGIFCDEATGRHPGYDHIAPCRRYGEGMCGCRTWKGMRFRMSPSMVAGGGGRVPVRASARHPHPDEPSVGERDHGRVTEHLRKERLMRIRPAAVSMDGTLS